MKFVAPRQIIFPGDLVASEDENVEGAVYLDNGKYRASSVGLVEFRENKIVIVPLEGVYRPKQGDIVIGYITDVLASGWEVDIRAPFPAWLPLNEAVTKYIDLERIALTSLLNIGDVVIAQVKDIDLTDEYPVTLTLREGERLGKIESGFIAEISPVKVPRVIGKKGSMLATISELGCELTIGQNGRIWAKCRDTEAELALLKVLAKIERESHVAGLTDRVKAFIESLKNSSKGGSL
ncbi:exosome complex RNA-binding protein Rrp4 [Thermoproteus tenax]|uniref:Exosome complex component Rrp4 n=1 Tax=Thermoproteus tenax (strain ATCC 35583 / DSM 2078 / JCM 9277 / NBRC 100435 / Kra 1) TaxID=768679 RepID=G4RPH7_THETK|nr:exosome complex RNA-binding protein Rrp4 [Thermoproteus tenax]CCC81472.1 exosome complex RNA-binding protein [Thermoproteus tenax Kra 1]